jgi:hypothetical protein
MRQHLSVPARGSEQLRLDEPRMDRRVKSDRSRGLRILIIIILRIVELRTDGIAPDLSCVVKNLPCVDEQTGRKRGAAFSWAKVRAGEIDGSLASSTAEIGADA